MVYKWLFFWVVSLGIFIQSFANDLITSEKKEFNATDFIIHHIGDSHEFHLFTWGENHFTIPLPIILWTEKGLITFMSSEFTPNTTIQKKGLNLIKYHEIIYILKNGQQTISFDKNNHPINVVKPLDFSITKNVFSIFLSAILLLWLFIGMGKAYLKSFKPTSGIYGFLEPLVLFVRDNIAIPNLGIKNYLKYMPYLLTVFFFIFINNLTGLIPFFPFGTNLTGSIATTFLLALITFFITLFSAKKKYWQHIFVNPDVPFWLYPVMIPVELLGMFVKPFSLMIRLFANISAGHIIILSLVCLIYIFGTVWIAPVSILFVLFMSIVEFLVAFLQAYIFTFLSSLFIGQAVSSSH